MEAIRQNGGVILSTSTPLGKSSTTGGIVEYIARNLDSQNLLNHAYCIHTKQTRISPQKASPARSGLSLLFPLINAAAKVGGLKIKNYQTRNRLFDQALAKKINHCAVLHTWDRSKESWKKAKSLGATVILEVEMDIWPGDDLQYVDYFIVPSRFLYQKALSIGIPENRLFYLPFGVDTDVFKPAATTLDSEQEKRYLFVGALNQRKGIHDLLEAWALADIPNAKLILCGRTTPFFRKRIQEYSEQKIEHLGFLNRQQLQAEFQRSHAFVFPSYKEGSAKVIYEALASGLPVITTEESGSVIEDGNEGFIVPKGDPTQIAQKMQTLAQDTALFKSMAEKARIKALDNTWQHYQDRSLKIYQSIFDEATRPTA